MYLFVEQSTYQQGSLGKKWELLDIIFQHRQDQHVVDELISYSREKPELHQPDVTIYCINCRSAKRPVHSSAC